MNRIRALSYALITTYIFFIWFSPIGIINSRKLYYSKNFYEDSMEAIKEIEQNFGDIVEVKSIGKSVDGRDIPVIIVGNGSKKILINGSHHAREFMTSILIMNQVEYTLQLYRQDKSVHGINVRPLLNEVSIYFVPFVNPDGIELVTGGLRNIRHRELAQGLSKDNIVSWKANLRGVDLNRNYPADPGEITDKALEPSHMNYPGPMPFSEPETQALKNLCVRSNFSASISYHSAGEIIYWYYMQSSKETEQRDYELALRFKEITGYKLVKKDNNPSGGGFKDWYIQVFKQPSYTFEIGKTMNSKPLKYTEYNKVWRDNKTIPIFAAKLIDINHNLTDCGNY